MKQLRQTAIAPSQLEYQTFYLRLWRDFCRAADRRGGKRGLVLHYLHTIKRRCGFYRKFEQIDWDRVERLIFVCQGNICRSPYAEAYARAMGLRATSFGIEADGVSPADPNAMKNARDRRVDLSKHRSKTSRMLDIRSGDLILVMEPRHAGMVRRIIGADRAQVTLLGLWSDENVVAYIHDPFGRTDAYFQACFARIDSSVHGIGQRFPAAANGSPLVQWDGSIRES